MNFGAENYNSVDPIDPSEFELEQQGRELEQINEQPEPAPAGSFERGFVWDSTLETIDGAEHAVMESLEALHWPEDKIEDFALAVREAVTNAVIHGNLGIRRNEGEPLDAYDARWRAAEQGPDGAKKVNMEIDANERGVKVVITDEGDFIAEPKPVFDSEGEERVMMPSGKGMGIIVDKCDAVEAGKGQLTLIKYRDNKATEEGGAGEVASAMKEQAA
jgi:anti-sigma regulatory factor (Ser/Thr protein kinase)